MVPPSSRSLRRVVASPSFPFCSLPCSGVRKLEALFGVLITTMAVTFGVEYIIAEPNQADVMLGLVRHSMTRASALRVGHGDSIRFSPPHAGGADAQ